MLSLNHNQQQEQYKWGYDDKREHLNKLMMDRGLIVALKQASADVDRYRNSTTPYDVGMRHAADAWREETQWMASKKGD